MTVVFVSDALSVPVPAPVARQRLLAHVDRDGLRRTATEAYRESAAAVCPDGDTGWPAQLSLSGVPCYERPRKPVLALRWLAAAPAGQTYPVLDADLELAAHGSGTQLRLVGSFRPPVSGSGAEDHPRLGEFGQLAAHGFLVRLAAVLAGP